VITVAMAMFFLGERISRLGALGVGAALAAIVLFSISGGSEDKNSTGRLLLSIVVCVCWGVQAFLMKKASNQHINDGSIFGYMTLSGLLLVPVALLLVSGSRFDFPWEAPALSGATQILNAVGALFLVMALSRGKAVIVAPCTNALAPVLTIVLSLIVYSTLPSIYSFIGVLLALTGSTLMVYSEEKRGSQPGDDSDEQAGGKVGTDHVRERELASI
jgi:drug/metabolite transporter (DMT)-like permease